MFKPIDMESFVDITLKANKDLKRNELEESLKEFVERKKNGAKCFCCGAPIWAIGSAMAGINMCFSCTTGDADNTDDYEIDKVCDI